MLIIMKKKIISKDNANENNNEENDIENGFGNNNENIQNKEDKDEGIQQGDNENGYEEENNQNNQGNEYNSNNNSGGNKSINIGSNHEVEVNNNIIRNNNLENNNSSEKENIENKNNENKDITQKENIEDNINSDEKINLARNINLDNGININKDINKEKKTNNNFSSIHRNKKFNINNKYNDNENDTNAISIKASNIIEDKFNIDQNQKGNTNAFQIYNKTNANQNKVYNINEYNSFSNYSLATPKKNEENYFYNDKINYTYKPKEIKTEQKKPIIYSCMNIKNELSKSKDSTFKISRDKYNPLEGNIFLDRTELELISNRIHGKKYKIYFNLLYRASQDKDNCSVFHKNCDKNQTTLILIETNKGHRFGGFTKRTWSGKGNEKFDNDAFIFSLNQKRIYNVIKGRNAIGCYPSCGPVFCGAFKIYDNAFSKGGCTYPKGLNYETIQDFELTNGEEKFGVKEIEVYEVKIA